MSLPRPPNDRFATLFAALFAGCFFAALPAFVLSRADGPATFDCRPSPWRCDVRWWKGFDRFGVEMPVARITVETRVQSVRRGRSVYQHQLTLESPRGDHRTVSGWLSDSPAEVVQRLADAQRRGVAAQARAASSYYTFMVVLTGFFFACGAGIVLVNDLSPRSPGGAAPRAKRRR